MYPYTKKVQQGAFLLFAYMLAAGLTAGAARAIAAENSSEPWMAAFLLGCLSMGISVFFYLSRKKHPQMSWLCLLLSAVGCGSVRMAPGQPGFADATVEKPNTYYYKQ